MCAVKKSDKESTPKIEENTVHPGRQFLNDNPNLVIKTKIGQITGQQLYMIEGFDMAWASSADDAGDVARRITNWVKERDAPANKNDIRKPKVK